MTAPAAGAPLTHPEIRRIIVGILMAMLLAALDQTIVATALPTIGADLDNFQSLSWVVTAYLLSSTAVTPLYGKLSDVHGRRVTLLCAIAVFSLGSLACALSSSMLALILARGLQGLGGGGLISLAQTVIADVVSPRERGRYQGYIASVFTASSVAGPVLGGVIAEHLHWSVIFWINLPLGLVAFFMTERALRRLPRHDRKARMDLPGAALMIVSAVSLLLALTWGGVRFAWQAPEILGLLAVFAVFAALFVWRISTAVEPFLPLTVLLNPVVGRGTVAALLTMGTLIGLTIYLPIYFESVRGLSASQSGLALIPPMAGLVVGSTLSGRGLALLTHYKRPAMVGLVSAVSTLVLLAAVPRDLPLWVVAILLGIMGTGMGSLLPVTTVSIQNAVLPHQLGTATGAMNFFRSLGAAVLVAAFGAVLMAALGITPGNGDIAELVSGADAGRLAHAFTLVFASAALCLSFALCWFLSMEERPLRTTVRKAAEEAGEVAVSAAE